MKGYKIFNSSFQCKGFQFAENTRYTHPGKPELCANGFHFCEKAGDLFSYYSFDPSNIVCEVEAMGEIATKEGENKSCTNDIMIGNRLTWEEVLKVANEGLNNTGHSNTGDSNTGNRNTGYSNTGNSNTGYSNTGNSNTGDRNTGYSNTGYSNTGDRNTGYSNTGNSNTGDSNTGDRNTGYSNTGDWNTGYSNTGNSNTGDRNTGDWNTGYSNTGDWNTGDRNTGYSNTGNRNTGAFCTEDALFPMFDKPSSWTEEDFKNSRAYALMCNNIDTKLWVPMSAMSDAEKETNRGWKTAEGYIKDIPFKEAFGNAWHNWSEENRNAFRTLPNFDCAVFEAITGVKA